MHDYDLTDINKNIQKCIERGAAGQDPVRNLIVADRFVPKEGWLWDYKSAFYDDKTSLAKTVLQIVSFYNTCGGYLVYGVYEEESDHVFKPCGVDPGSLKKSQLRDQIKNYTGYDIDFNYDESFIEVAGQQFLIGTLYVPKRPFTINPVRFIKRGPQKNKNQYVFDMDHVYIRRLDECKRAVDVEDWQLLFSSRDVNELSGIGFRQESSFHKLDHNLPDKSLICQNFIGRGEIVAALWDWLSDPFEYTKILAGDGGKGKTSIAYHFSCQFLNTAPYGYERVFWVSGKERQFSGIYNDYYDLGESDFKSDQEFLCLLAGNFGMLEEDYKEISLKQLKRIVQEGVKTFPSLIVVDNLDYLDDEGQKRVVDYCRQLGGEYSRFLLTTRKKFSFSDDLCIPVPGLPYDEYKELLEAYSSKYGISNIKSADVKNMHKSTDGSPLLTESILRIVKLGASLGSAIKQYKEEAGEDARNAALRKEVDSLSSDAKRALLCVALFGSCSATEIKQVLGVEKLKLRDSLEELQSLFLVDEPEIIEDEPRYSVTYTTQLLVGGMKDELAHDHQRIEREVKGLRKGGKWTGKQGNRKSVGQAITQSIAFLKEGDIDSALRSVDAELGNQPNHPDLLLAKGRVLLKQGKPAAEAARKTLRKAYDEKQRKDLLFDLWFEAEEICESVNGMIEVANLALRFKNVDKASWKYGLARGLILRSRVREGGSRIDDLIEASSNISQVIKETSSGERQIRIQEVRELNDLIWKLASEYQEISWITVYEYMHRLINEGDLRTKMYERCSVCLAETRRELEKEFKDRKNDAYRAKLGQFRRLLDGRSDEDKSDRPFTDLLERI